MCTATKQDAVIEFNVGNLVCGMEEYELEFLDFDRSVRQYCEEVEKCSPAFNIRWDMCYCEGSNKIQGDDIDIDWIENMMEFVFNRGTFWCWR